MNKKEKEEFVERMKTTQSIHLTGIADLMGLSWGDVKKEIIQDEKFRAKIEEVVERFKYEIYQQAFERATGRRALRQSFDLSTVRAMLNLLSSGEIIPGSEPKSPAPKGATSDLDLLERIGLGDPPNTSEELP